MTTYLNRFKAYSFYSIDLVDSNIHLCELKTTDNKRKLKGNLLECKRAEKDGVLEFFLMRFLMGCTGSEGTSTEYN